MATTHTGKPLDEIRGWLREGAPERAAAACAELLRQDPRNLNALLLYSRAAEQQADFERMLRLSRQAVELKPRNTDARLRLARSLLLCGDVEAAAGGLRHLENTGSGRPRLLHRVADVYAEFGWHPDARRCHLRAMELQPDEPVYLLGAVRACRELGLRGQARKLLERVVFLDPEQHTARYLRACLTEPGPDGSQVRELSFLIDKLEPGAPGRVTLCFALARVLDALGRYEESFLCLREGAELRRKGLTREGGAEEARMLALASAGAGRRPASAPPGPPRAGPVMVAGLPCSGAGRVVRMIGSHGTSQRAALTVLYPALHLGPLAQLRPDARIILVRRHPLDHCMAIYRTLFRDRHPYSYDLGDIGRYYIAHARLMAHWRALHTDAILEVNYDRLLTMRERQLRRLLDHAGLAWDAACLNAMERRDPDAGIHMRYRRQLSDLRGQLAEHGIHTS